MFLQKIIIIWDKSYSDKSQAKISHNSGIRFSTDTDWLCNQSENDYMFFFLILQTRVYVTPKFSSIYCYLCSNIACTDRNW